MADLKSVGIQVTETDLTPVTQPVSSSIGAYVGHFNWGPVDEPIRVSSELLLGQYFGTPNKASDKTAKSFLIAESFLKYGNSLEIVRAIGDTAKNAASVVGSETTTSNAVLLKNKSQFDIASTASLVSDLYARYPGEHGNALSVLIIHADNYETNKAESKKFFTVAPDTTEWATETSDVEYTNDEVHVIVYDAKGVFTGIKDAVIEIWQGLSLNENARTISGGNNYWVDVLNAGSAYVYASSEATIASLSGTTYSLTGDGVYNFAGGDNGSDPTADNVVDSLAVLEDSDNVDINLVFAEAFEDDESNGVNQALIELASARKDCVVFLSAPLDLYRLSTNELKLAAVQTAKGELSGTNNEMSYTVLDSTPVYVYNKYADTQVWIPACGHMAGLCAYTDDILDPWFSPAGYNRGQLRGVSKIAYQPTQTERDELYNANINPIISTPGQGILLFGDKTGQTRPSAFDRINVRRLFITLQRVCSLAAKYQLFELNDEFTRNTFINTIDPYLRDVQGRRGITDFKIVCDETNNTAQVIDTNRFVADIYVKPARSINYITLNFVATRTGLSFSEVGTAL